MLVLNRPWHVRVGCVSPSLERARYLLGVLCAGEFVFFAVEDQRHDRAEHGVSSPELDCGQRGWRLGEEEDEQGSVQERRQDDVYRECALSRHALVARTETA